MPDGVGVLGVFFFAVEALFEFNHRFLKQFSGPKIDQYLNVSHQCLLLVWALIDIKIRACLIKNIRPPEGQLLPENMLEVPDVEVAGAP